MFRTLLASSLLAVGFLVAPAARAAEETAIFAGGCFWCVESDMDHVKGVVSTTSGYAGGAMQNPSYEDHEGYAEAVKVVFDNSVISYDSLVGHFLRTIDVTDDGGQFCDRGDSYIPALFPIDEKQKASAAAALKAAAADLGQDIKVKLSDTPSFFDAEGYHQDYYLGTKRTLTRFGWIKQSDAYHRYREGCGRDARVKEVWGSKAYTYLAGGGNS